MLDAFAQLGVVVLLFWAGLETRLEDVRSVGSSALRVGALGIAVPFVVGVGAGLARIVVAGIGATAGALTQELFAVLIAVSVLTTLVAPPLLRRRQGSPHGGRP